MSCTTSTVILKHSSVCKEFNTFFHCPEFGQAEAQFDKILAIDPERIDDIDIYSNILYVTDNQLKLSKIAHEFLALDKDRPEVCCLIGKKSKFTNGGDRVSRWPGNHYSLRSEHEKAVKYFRRATQLDRTYLSAWTLMGHEYVEMKNSHAAIEAYRRAVGEAECLYWEIAQTTDWEYRCKSKGLQGMVRSWASLWIVEYASLCTSLLSASYCVKVRIDY